MNYSTRVIKLSAALVFSAMFISTVSAQVTFDKNTLKMDDNPIKNADMLSVNTALTDGNISDSITAGTVNGFVTATTPLAAGNISDDSLAGAQLNSSVTGSNLSLSGNAIKVDHNFVMKSGDSMSGNLDMGSNSIDNIGGLQGCGANEFVNGNGNCVTDSTSSGSAEDLNETLTAGNEANQSINMMGNSIGDVSEIGLQNALNDDNVSDSITVDGGTVKNSFINVGTSPALNDGNVSDSITASGFVNPSVALNADNLSLGSGVENDGSGNLQVNTGNGVQLSSGVAVQTDGNTLAVGGSGVKVADDQLAGSQMNSSVAGTELVLSGNSLNVQDVWVNESGDSMTGDLDMGGNSIGAVSEIGLQTTLNDDNVSDTITVDGGFVSVPTGERLNSGNLSSSVAGSGLSGGAGSALSVDNGNALNVTSDTLGVDEGAISHDNIAGVSSGDHHTQPSTGNGLSGSTTFSVQVDGNTLAVGGSGVKVADDQLAGSQMNTTLAGSNLSLSGNSLNVDDDFVFNSGDSMTGNLDMSGNSIGQVSQIGLQNALGDDNVSDSITINGGFVSVDSTEPLGDGNVSDTITVDGGFVNPGTTLIAGNISKDSSLTSDGSNNLAVASHDSTITTKSGGIDVADGGITSVELQMQTINESHIRIQSVNESHVLKDAVNQTHIKSNAVGDTEAADSLTIGSNGKVNGAFVSVDSAEDLTDGNISDTISIRDGFVSLSTETLNSGNISFGSSGGLKGSSGNLAVEPNDFAGSGLTDNSDSLDVSTGTGINVTNGVAVDLKAITDGNLSASGSTIDVNHNFVMKSGDSMSGDLDMGSNNVTGVSHVNVSDSVSANGASSCTAGEEGSITYNGTHHLGCGESGGSFNWEPLY